jgi:hypothetical protein
MARRETKKKKSRCKHLLMGDASAEKGSVEFSQVFLVLF